MCTEKRHIRPVRGLPAATWRRATSVPSVVAVGSTGSGRDRVLNDDEIRTLWWGLDRDGMPAERHVCVAIRMILTTMVRPYQAAGAQISSLLSAPTTTTSPSERPAYSPRSASSPILGQPARSTTCRQAA